MADSKITELTELLTLADDDLFAVVDDSEIPKTTKKVKVSTLTSSIPDVALNTAHRNTVTGNPHSVTKAEVGLGSVDNTSDADKPISTATQTALDGKYDSTNPNGYETPLELDARDTANRSRANHTGTQLASTISDFDIEVSNNTSVAANTAKVSADGSVTTHSDVTNAGSGEIITTLERSKLSGIEAGAEVNNISDINATDLTDAGDTTLHFHSSDRARANHTGTQLAATISDFDSTVNANTNVTGSVTAHSDVTNAGSGAIITTAERTLLNHSIYAWLQYSNSTAQTTASATFSSMALATDRESFPNGELTKVNTTDFRTDFNGKVRVSFSVSFHASANARTLELGVQRNTTDLVWTQKVQMSNDNINEPGQISGEFILDCAVNDIFRLRMRNPLANATMTIPIDRATFKVEAIYRA